MKTKEIFLTILLGQCANAIHAQGTFEFDQQSSTGGIFEGVYNIQSSQPIGQSFTPTLNAVGFVQLGLADLIPANSPTVYVNLLSDSINGPVIAQSMPVTLPINFEGTVNFFFAIPATVSPGTTYYFQPVVPSGTAYANVSSFYNYSGGTSFINGTADPTRNFYFREGIVTTPEPSTWALLVLGGGALWFRRRSR